MFRLQLTGVGGAELLGAVDRTEFCTAVDATGVQTAVEGAANIVDETPEVSLLPTADRTAQLPFRNPPDTVPYS